MNPNVISFNESVHYGCPTPSESDPYAQVKWIFEERGSRVPTKSGQDNYRYALSHFLKYLQESHGDKPYLLKNEWDSLVLIRFKAWLSFLEQEDRSKFGSHTIVGILSSVRQVMTEAVILEVAATSSILSASMSPGDSATDSHASYSTDELASILEAVRTDMQYTSAVLAGYQPLGIGRDPQVRPTGLKINPQKYAEHGYGWNCEPNVRWYFENKMNSRAISRTAPTADQHKAFFTGAVRYHGGYMNLYKKWGVTPQLDNEILWPLVVQLSYLTGLNPDSLMGLKADCLSENPLTGTPVLRYLKLRSQGEKDLLVDLLNDDAEVPETDQVEDAGEEMELPLKRQQALLVERCIGKTLQLTAPLRQLPDVSEDLKELLFIYESSGNNCHGEIQAAPVWKVSQWCRDIAEKHDLKSSNGERLQFTLVRFRPTLLTEMAARGKDFFEIQHAAGHKSIKTTLAYIEQRTLDTVAEREVTSALVKIWRNRDEFTASLDSTKPSSRAQPLKGLISNCKNVFDPPRVVQLRADYAPGQSCTQFNMCLFCKNIVIMNEHLPVLAYYRNQIRSTTVNSGIDLPNIALYEKSLAVLDQIFDPESSNFTEEELDEAIAASETLDIVIDPLVYRGEDTSEDEES
jgi:hypothetical protein